MNNRHKIERLRRLIGQADQAKTHVERSITALQLRQLTREDRDILERLPVAVQATYRQGDQWDSVMTRSRLRTCGSIVESVGIDVASEALRERRTEVV